MSVSEPSVKLIPLKECENEVVCISYAAAECLAAFPPPLISWTRSLSQCALCSPLGHAISQCALTGHTSPTCVTTRGRVDIVNGVNNFPQPLSWFLLAANFHQGHYADLQLRTDLQSSCLQVCPDPFINLQQSWQTIFKWTHQHITSRDIKCRMAECGKLQAWWRCHPRLHGIGCRVQRGPRPNFVWRDFIINRDKDL